MQRRQFLKVSVMGAAVGITSASAIWLSQGNAPEQLTITALLAKLNQLTMLSTEQLAHLSHGKWNSAEVFAHCAQSVEFSMSGFPEHKSALFKQTVGALAFTAFATKGAMSHNLAEPIPAAPKLDRNLDVNLALARLIQSLTDFQQYQAEFAPHFAYGELNKADYELAHVLHFYNHQQSFTKMS
ncbi:DUF1569 domain-containing protein [Shewanella sp. SG44-2]|uniref:DUF1569 domain-containing protein n=1 Tax=Shewanella sp. SG44-2 TaxID=2760962 RepID=UPI0016045321|nr:DUF1569 domain-containing protein [Shewanella sp. SG44-2]MBB1383740.1 DUF1569 domain-containing protein [Shewanella sp. SR41-2]MBB1426476.1 DUF1569 domain-containing protein [Shewanella sp. SG44-2]